MSQEELEKIFHKGLGKNQALFLARQILDGVYPMDEVFDACLNANESVAMKSSYVLSAVGQLDADALESKSEVLIRMIEESPIQGTRREALRMLTFLYPWEASIERKLVDLCLFIMESDETATGEKYHSMRIMEKVGDDHREAMKQFTAMLKMKLPELTEAMQRQAMKRFFQDSE